MPVLVSRLYGFAQSWDVYGGRMKILDCGNEVSKSGYLGLLCKAGGIPREDEETLTALANCTMAVRVDRPGRKYRDFHTVGGAKGEGVPKANNSKPKTVVTHRYYLINAEFMVFLEGDAELLDFFNDAQHSPQWDLFLGRKSCSFGLPMGVSANLFPGTLEEAIINVPWRSTESEPTPELLRVVKDTWELSNDERMDVPLTFHPKVAIKHGLRWVKTEWVKPNCVSEDWQCTFIN